MAATPIKTVELHYPTVKLKENAHAADWFKSCFAITLLKLGEFLSVIRLQDSVKTVRNFCAGPKDEHERSTKRVVQLE